MNLQRGFICHGKVGMKAHGKGHRFGGMIGEALAQGERIALQSIGKGKLKLKRIDRAGLVIAV